MGNGIAQCSRHDLFVANKLRSVNCVEVPPYKCEISLSYVILASLHSGTAVRMTEPIIRNPSLDYFQKEGAFFLQNLPSVVCGHVLEPLPGQNVLDMCAAPGILSHLDCGRKLEYYF